MKKTYDKPIINIIDISEYDVLTGSTLGERLPGDEEINMDDL